MKYRNWIEINERALRHNINQLRSLLSSGARFCAVIKANAYGHDLKTVARIASREDVDAFAVDNIDDALFLREIFPSALILVLGYTMQERLDDAVCNNIHLTVYDVETIKTIESLASRRATEAFLHLKVETGTYRQGVLTENLQEILELIRACDHLRLVGISTHFANLEDTRDMNFAQQQFERLNKAVEQVIFVGLNPSYIHSACSAAIILYPQTHDALVRAGISMYGLWSSDAVEASARQNNIRCDLIPVLSWKSRIAQIKHVPAGTAIGYGLSERVQKDTRIAILPVGYWDGYNRKLSSTGEILVSGCKCKVMGRVCMNMTMVDVSHVPDPCVEQEVTLLGREGQHSITAEQIAKKTGTINYEVVSRINPMLPRIVI